MKKMLMTLLFFPTSLLSMNALEGLQIASLKDINRPMNDDRDNGHRYPQYQQYYQFQDQPNIDPNLYEQIRRNPMRFAAEVQIYQDGSEGRQGIIFQEQLITDPDGNFQYVLRGQPVRPENQQQARIRNRIHIEEIKERSESLPELQNEINDQYEEKDSETDQFMTSEKKQEYAEQEEAGIPKAKSKKKKREDGVLLAKAKVKPLKPHQPKKRNTSEGSGVLTPWPFIVGAIAIIVVYKGYVKYKTQIKKFFKRSEQNNVLFSDAAATCASNTSKSLII